MKFNEQLANNVGYHWIVELEDGVWLADGDGDPPRTSQMSNARKFNSNAGAIGAIWDAREYRPFFGAKPMRIAHDS